MPIPILPAILLSLCTIVCVLLVIRGLRGTDMLQPVVAGLVIWVLLLGMLSLKGVFADFSAVPPRIGLAMFIPLPVVLWVIFSKNGTALIKKIPPHWPIYLQSFRIVVELILWMGVKAGAIPVQMSFEGRNFDILSGLFALPVGYFCYVKKAAPRWVALLYNIGGLLLLLNIIVIAVLSMPTPLRVFYNEPANTLVGHFPFIYLPGLLVPLAYTLHIFSLRQWKNGILAELFSH